MKKLCYCLFICVFIITCLMWLDIYFKHKELESETYIKLLQMEERIEAQNKEIRILRQDMDIIENGYRPN